MEYKKLVPLLVDLLPIPDNMAWNREYTKVVIRDSSFGVMTVLPGTMTNTLINSYKKTVLPGTMTNTNKYVHNDCIAWDNDKHTNKYVHNDCIAWDYDKHTNKYVHIDCIAYHRRQL